MNIRSNASLATVRPHFAARLGSAEQQKRYEAVLTSGIDSAIRILDQAKNGSLNHGHSEYATTRTPEILAALHILNRVFPVVGNDFTPQ